MNFLINHQYKEKKADRSYEIFIKDSAHTMLKEVTKRWDFQPKPVLTYNIYPNHTFSVYISSQTKSIILQNPADTNFFTKPISHQTQISLFYKTHQCLEKLKKTFKHKQKQSRAPEQKLRNKNIKIQRNTKQSKVGLWRERENLVTQAEVRADELTDVGAGER